MIFLAMICVDCEVICPSDFVREAFHVS